MHSIPEGLKVKPEAFEKTGSPNVLRPTYGSLGSMFAEFKVHERYSGKLSQQTGTETTQPIEVCIIQTDRFSRVPKRVTELSRKESIDLAPLYERFKSQQGSTDTSILEWNAVSDVEKVHLGQLGIWSVEQLHNLPEHERYRLGPGGNELWVRAERHVLGKEAKVAKETAEAKKELHLLAEENKKLREQLEARVEKSFERHAEIAANQKRSKPQKETTEVSE